jgi:hypothetical protein
MPFRCVLVLTLSRDPSEERGDGSSYGMVSNNTANKVDYLGLWGICTLGATRTRGTFSVACWTCPLFFMGRMNCLNCSYCVYTPGPARGPQTSWYSDLSDTRNCGACASWSPPPAPKTCPPLKTGPVPNTAACLQAIQNPTETNCIACCDSLYTTKGLRDVCRAQCKGVR